MLYKFRAWSRNNKRMYYRVLAGCNLNDDSYVAHLVWVDDKKDWANFDDLSGEVMQYTGRNDVNNCEIFVGDIVVFTYGKYHREPNGLKRIGIVDYSSEKASFVVRVKDSKVEVNFINIENNDIQILGNKYQNPELLD